MYISLFGAAGHAQDADALYADREHPGSARHAADIWSAEAQRGDAFDAAWKLARVCYWLGNNAPENERRQFLEHGIAAGRQAATEEPSRPEGHYWLAANMGALAESYGLREGLKYRKPIKEELETVLRIDPAYQQGGADRALGRWYNRVPRLFGGSNARAEEHLKAALKYGDQSIITHFFLAEVYLDEGRKADGRAELQRVLDLPLSTDYAPEDRGYKQKARQRLEKL